MDEDEFLTIDSPQQAEIKIKGSKFIGNADFAATENQAKEFIQQISRKYFDATHHCFAFKCGLPPNEMARYQDAGEPSGTAGLPILTMINRKNLTNIVLVVTRYFGGTKLGTGGLSRAYSDCARTVLEQSTLVKKYVFQKIQLQFEYGLTGAVMRVVSRFGARIDQADYSEVTNLNVEIRKSRALEFGRNLSEITAGRILIKAIDQ